jgi:hypothetical protein
MRFRHSRPGCWGRWVPVAHVVGTNALPGVGAAIGTRLSLGSCIQANPRVARRLRIFGPLTRNCLAVLLTYRAFLSTPPESGAAGRTPVSSITAVWVAHMSGRWVRLIPGILSAKAAIACAGQFALLPRCEPAILAAATATASAIVGAPRIDDHGRAWPCARCERDYYRCHETCTMQNSHEIPPGRWPSSFCITPADSRSVPRLLRTVAPEAINFPLQRGG